MQDVMTNELVVKDVAPVGGRDVRRQHILAAVIVLFAAIITSYGALQSSRPLELDDSISRLDGAVLRLMMADEISGDDEVQRATDSLESLLSLSAARESQLSPATQELNVLAGQIRDALANADRKLAVETLVTFREKADAADAALFRAASGAQSGHVNWLLWSGLSLLFCGSGFFWWLDFKSRGRLQTLQSDSQRKESEMHQLAERFDQERQRTIELQQRLIESGKSFRRLESTIEDYSVTVTKLETSVKYLKSLLGDSESRVKALSAELEQAKQAYADSCQKISSFEVVLDAAARSEAALEARHEQLMKEKDEEIQALISREREARDNREATTLDSQPSIVASNTVPTGDIEVLRAELAQARVKFDSEYAVVEWSNTKLRAEIAELNDEISRLKESLLNETKNARNEINQIKAAADEEKRAALRALSDEHEAEVKLLRNRLREIA